jgi:Flp pilus assembly protein TadG
LARLLRDEEGSYLLYMTVAIPAFLGLASFATEGALIFYNHRTVQSAADAAAYSAAIAYSIDSTADITTQAQAIVANYGLAVGSGNNEANVVATVDTITYSPLTAIDVAITRPQLPILSSIWVSSPFSVSGSAKAIISGGAGGGNGNCILSIAPTGFGIKLLGTPTITAPGCGVYSNSNGSCSGGGSATPSIDLGGNGSIIAGSVGAAGCVSVTGSSNIGPPPNGYTSGNDPVINPYANVPVPSPSGPCVPAPGTPAGRYQGTGQTPLNVTVPAGNYCSDINIQNNAHVTLNPGTFDGSISVATNSSLTLNPGVYIFNGPVNLTVDAQSSLTGEGVTLVFTDPGGATYPRVTGTPTALNIQSGAMVDLQAPTSGATQGMLIIGDTNIPLDTAFNLQANAAGTGISGVIYIPTGDFTWGGGPILAGGCTQMIAYRVIMSGNAVFDNSNCDLSGGGGGGAKPIGNVVTLVK